MTKRHRFNLQTDASTREKLEYLKWRYESYSKAVAVAIDRLYRAERQRVEQGAHEATPPQGESLT